MKLAQGREKYYYENKKLNSDDYGKFIFRHVDEWSELLEEKLDTLTSIEDRITFLVRDCFELEKKTSTYNSGLSGFQHYLTCKILFSTWVYGFELYQCILFRKKYKGYTVRNEGLNWLKLYSRTLDKEKTKKQWQSWYYD